MKKKAWILGLAAAACSVTAFAAPVNQMESGDTAAGIATDGAYVEHKTGNTTIGYTYMARDEYANQDAVYLQYDAVGTNLKGIAGYRWNMYNVNGDGEDKANPYIGAAVSTPKIFGFDGYASFVAGKNFNEVQIGVNKNLIANVDLNVSYHNFKPDEGDRENGVGVGVSMKF